MDSPSTTQPAIRPFPEVERPIRRRISRDGITDYDFAPVKVPDALADGTLPLPYPDQDVEIRIPLWIDLPIQAKDTYVVLLQGADVTEEFVLTQEDIDRGEDLRVILPKALFAGPDNIYFISYAVTPYPGGERLQASRYYALRIDRTAPGGEGLGKIDFDDDIELNGLTDEKLSELGDVLEGEVPDYFGREVGDIVQPYIGNDIPVDPIEIGSAHLGGLVTAKFTRKQLEDAGGKGIVTFYYRVTDRAKNTSTRSVESNIRLYLIDEPVRLIAPYIYAMHDATTPNVVVEAEARAGVAVGIPQYTNVAAGDEIILVWGGIRLPAVTVRSSDIKPEEPAAPLFDINVSYEVVQAASDQSRYASSVSYIVKRNREIESDAAPVVVNITIPGGPDPDPETPANENLYAPRVRGNASGQDNKLTPEDSVSGATATIRGITTETPAKIAFAVNDQIQLYWQGNPAGLLYTVTSADVGNDIVLPVSSATIVGGGSGAVPVHYSVRRSNAPDPGFNTALSPTQPVTVTLEGDLPGEGKLDLAVFTEANRNNAIGYFEAISEGGTPLALPWYKNKKVGDVIFVHFIGNDRLDGSGNPIEASRYTFTHYVSGNDEDTSTIIDIPTEYLLQVIYGSAHAYYTVTNSYGTSRSELAFVLMDTRH